MRNILLALKIVQKVSNEQRMVDGLQKLGRGYLNAYRLNPFNPLSYLVVLISIPITLLLFGFMGFYQRVENPFKWN